MCFEISRGAKAPKQRIAYKRVYPAGNGSRQSLYYPDGGICWRNGDVVTASSNGAPLRYSVGNKATQRSKHGIYVYLTKHAAMKHVCIGEIIIAVRVSPRSFLYRGKRKNGDGLVATYRRVRVIGPVT